MDDALCRALAGSAGGLGFEVARFSADPTATDMHRLLVSYWQAGREAADGHTSFSIALDKSRVFGRSCANCVIALRNNVAFWTPVQVRERRHSLAHPVNV